MAKRENSPTLYSYVKEYVMKLIISGKYPAHSQLPTEYELMDTLNVGRATVRAALAQLEHEGTIYKRQGVGTFVSERNKHYGLEPFISMSFTLKNLGLQEQNEIFEQHKVKVESEPLITHWEAGTEVYNIKRLRKIEDTTLAMEDNYYSPYAYFNLNKKEIDLSLSHNLLTYLDDRIDRLENTTVVRNPTMNECTLLNIKPSEKVVEVQRWMFCENVEEAINYASMVIPTHVLEFPFLG